MEIEVEMYYVVCLKELQSILLESESFSLIIAPIIYRFHLSGGKRVKELQVIITFLD